MGIDRFSNAFVAALAFAAVSAQGFTVPAQSAVPPDGGGRSMGFVPSPLRAQEMKSSRRARLLRSTGESPVLPERWDSREKGWITPVRNQQKLGTCWAFGAIATIEAQFLKAGLGERDFSEKNLVNLSASEYEYNSGGNYNIASGYILRWSGPVDEVNDVYVGNTNDWPKFPSPALAAEARIRDVLWLPALDGTEESRYAIKCAITNHGAVGTSMCWENRYANGSAYYCYEIRDANHAVALVGWDDAYPTNAFSKPPPGPGAWIMRNSWGTASAGDNGYYYISYHDKKLGNMDNVVFTLPQDGRRYDSVHGYDLSGPQYDTSWDGYCNPTIYCDLQAVVFTAAWAERLEAVGFWTRIYPNPCEISVYTNVTRRADPPASPAVPREFLPDAASSPLEGGALACRQTVVYEHAGYTTVALDSPVTLAPGTSYAIVVRQTGSEISTIVGGCYEVNSNAQYYADHRITRGNGYIGWTKDGGSIRWADAYDGGIYAADMAGWTICIRAYTCNTAPPPSSDKPAPADNGRAMLLEIANDYPALYSETFSVDALSALGGANGRSLWASWLAGFVPSDPSPAELTVAISFTNGAPCVEWSPDLGDSRAYTLWGLDAFGGGDVWRPVDPADPSATGARFFKVTVGPRAE